MTQEKNPAPWPSFGHVGVWYAEKAMQQVAHLAAPTVLLQRWWRQHKLSRNKQKLYPIIIDKRAYCVPHSVERITDLRSSVQDANLLTSTWAYEKLDGTNLGVRCDGAVFGRRLRVYGDSYQNVSLKGAIPTVPTIKAVKSCLLGELEDDRCKLVLYGELMCNGKFGYDERDMFGKFYCFGAVFEFSNTPDDRVETIGNKLAENGFIATIGEAGKIRLRMNEKLSTLVRAHDIECAPLLDQGPLREICFRLKETLMSDDLEGVVLSTEDGSLFKWKTSHEDESKGYNLLNSLLMLPNDILEFACVDVYFAQCLADVSRKDVVVAAKPARGAKKQQKATKAQAQPFDAETFDKAYTSALSKYDAPEAFFEREEMSTIVASLKAELVADLGASTEQETKFIVREVGKRVGTAYGKWKRTNK